MNYPESFREAARQADAAHPGDVEAAVDSLLRSLARNPDFEAYQKSLIREAVRLMIYTARTRVSAAVRHHKPEDDSPAVAAVNPTRPRPGRPPVVVARSTTIEEVHGGSMYQLRAMGTTLGDMTAGDLAAWRQVSASSEKTHRENALLAEWLEPQLKGEKRVRDVVPESEMRKKYDAIKRRVAHEMANRVKPAAEKS